MTEEAREQVSPEELERQSGEPLPDREVMSMIDPAPGPFTPADDLTLPAEPGGDPWPPDPLPVVE
jgi:hypothetical protein